LLNRRFFIWQHPGLLLIEKKVRLTAGRGEIELTKAEYYYIFQYV